MLCSYNLSTCNDLYTQTCRQPTLGTLPLTTPQSEIESKHSSPRRMQLRVPSSAIVGETFLIQARNAFEPMIGATIRISLNNNLIKEITTTRETPLSLNTTGSYTIEAIRPGYKPQRAIIEVKEKPTPPQHKTTQHPQHATNKTTPLNTTHTTSLQAPTQPVHPVYPWILLISLTLLLFVAYSNRKHIRHAISYFL